MRNNADECQHARDFEHQRARLQHIELAAIARVIAGFAFHDGLPERMLRRLDEARPLGYTGMYLEDILIDKRRISL